jgi:hypothetical protein
MVRLLPVDLAAQRVRPDGPREAVFRGLPRDTSKFFPAAARRGSAALPAKGMDGARLDGVPWHSCRPTFANGLVVAGVDLKLGSGEDALNSNMREVM